MKRIVVLIDGSNIHASCKELGFSMDYSRLLKYFNVDAYVVHAYYFTALPPKTEQSGLRQMTDWLSYNGYILVTKEQKTFGTVIKGNMDVEIAVQAMQSAHYDRIDELVLMTGDGDFKSVIEVVQSRGVRVKAISAMEMAADELRRQADEFIDLVELRDALKQQSDGSKYSNSPREIRKRLLP